MSEDPQAFLIQLAIVLVAVAGGFRFRRWAVAGRARVPRYSQTVETIVCWGLYGAGVSFCVFIGSNWWFEYQQLPPG